MNGGGFHAITALRLIGFVYLLMPLIVWLALRGRHRAASLAAWCIGAAAYGGAYTLYGFRGQWPDLVTVYLAGLMTFSSYGLRIASLRLEQGLPAAWGRAALAVLAAWLLLLAAGSVSEGLRFATGGCVQLVATAALAWAARRLWQVSGLRSARAIALVYAIFSVSWLLLLLDTGLGGWDAVVGRPTVLSVLAMLGSIAAGVYGSLGFLGLSMERLHARELQQAQQLAQVSAQRKAAEEQAGQLRVWLDERDEMLRLLAHEVRQPLHNATSALQAARRAMAPAEPDAAAAARRLQRAEVVLSQIIGTLDNTLAATALLASPDRVERRDADVDTLLALAIGDLGVAARARVRIDKLAHTRTAVMDAGLLRLALRNLLSNALAYSQPASPVVLRVSDSDDPLALVFEVIDEGPGVDSALAARVFERGVRGTEATPGHGLGLYVVRRVMELHGGSADLRDNAGKGSIFRLTLPQDLADTLPPSMPAARRAHGS